MLREKLKDYNIILASKSPRRQQFLKDLDIDFTVETKDIEEIYPKELKGVEITDFLSNLKSKSFDPITCLISSPKSFMVIALTFSSASIGSGNPFSHSHSISILSILICLISNSI